MSVFEKGIVSFSVDDGYADAYRLYRLLKQYGMAGTFNIVTSWIGTPGYLSAEQLAEIRQDEDMEIACHGYSHKNTDADILLGIQQLDGWFGTHGEAIGFASPGSGMKKPHVLENEAHLRKDLGLLYVRSAYDPEPNARHLELMEKLTAADAPAYVIKNIPQLIYEISGMYLPSVVVYNDTECEHLKTIADLAAREKACAIFMLHRVKPREEEDPSDRWCYDYDKLEELLRHVRHGIDRGELRSLTSREIFESA